MRKVPLYNSEGRPIFFHFETLPVALLDDRIVTDEGDGGTKITDNTITGRFRADMLMGFTGCLCATSEQVVSVNAGFTAA